MKLLKSLLLSVAIVMLVLWSGSKVMSQEILVKTQVLKEIRGEMDKKDSLIKIGESIIVSQQRSIDNYEKIISNLNKKITILEENYQLNNVAIINENKNLLVDNKKLKRQRNIWRSVAIGVPVIISGIITYSGIR